MDSVNRPSSIWGIVGNLIMWVVFAYDAIESMGQNRHLYSIVFKFAVALFFAAKMVMGIIDHTKKELQGWKYFAYIGLAVYLLLAFVAVYVVSVINMEDCPWYILVIGVVVCLYVASEALKFKQR